MSHGIRIAAAAMAAAAVLSGCSSTEFTAPEPQVIEEATFHPSLEVDLSRMTQSESGLYYEDLVVGEGPSPVAGDTVVVRYAGYLTSGAQFQADEITYIIGEITLIAGWEEAVAGMAEGGARKVVIPPSLGYGSGGRAPSVPPGAVLVFDLELLELNRPGGEGS